MNSKGLTKPRRVFWVRGLGYPWTQSYCYNELNENGEFWVDWADIAGAGHVFLFTIDWPPRAEFAVKVCGG